VLLPRRQLSRRLKAVVSSRGEAAES